MSNTVFESIYETIKFVAKFLYEMSWPLAVIVGAGIVAYAVKGSVLGRDGKDLTRTFGGIFAYIVSGLFIVCGWAFLDGLESLAWHKFHDEENKATREVPIVNAPPIEQSGPVFAAIVEKTYSRTLTLPPEFFQRIGADGVGALSPYLVDPSAENVKSMVDSFRRSGEDVVFTRNLTRSDESPMPFDSASVKVDFHRLGDRAFRVLFSAEYAFTNEEGSPIEGRFLFYPPQSGTVQAVKVQVHAETVKEPNDKGYYEWIGRIEPGAQKRATVTYESVGTNSWSYQLGSLRRRVRDFSLTAKIDGPIEFQVGTINPTSRQNERVEWHLNDLLTAQRLGLVFPEDVAARDAFLEGLSVLPVCFVLVLTALVAVGIRTTRGVSPKRLALAAATTVIGLASSFSLVDYFGFTTALIVGSLVTAISTAAMTQMRSLCILIPVAMIPVAAMGQMNAPLWFLVIAIASVGLLVSPIYVKMSDAP